MIRNAATGYVLEAGIGIELGIEMPLLFPAGRIRGEQPLMGGTQIKSIPHFYWRDFIGDFTGIVGLF